MEKFLNDLRNKPNSHKKRFAFFTSSSVTALIFMIWAISSFGLPQGNVQLATSVQTKVSYKAEETKKDSPTPFENLREGIVGAAVAAGPYLKEAGDSIVHTDLETSYQEMRKSAFEKYGR
jgi:hypothetical protein